MAPQGREGPGTRTRLKADEAAVGSAAGAVCVSCLQQATVMTKTCTPRLSLSLLKTIRFRSNICPSLLPVR